MFCYVALPFKIPIISRPPFSGKDLSYMLTNMVHVHVKKGKFRGFPNELLLEPAQILRQ